MAGKSRNRAILDAHPKIKPIVSHTYDWVVRRTGLEPLTPDVHHDAQRVYNNSKTSIVSRASQKLRQHRRGAFCPIAFYPTDLGWTAHLFDHGSSNGVWCAFGISEPSSCSVGI